MGAFKQALWLGVSFFKRLSNRLDRIEKKLDQVIMSQGNFDTELQGLQTVAGNVKTDVEQVLRDDATTRQQLTTALQQAADAANAIATARSEQKAIDQATIDQLQAALSQAQSNALTTDRLNSLHNLTASLGDLDTAIKESGSSTPSGGGTPTTPPDTGTGGTNPPPVDTTAPSANPPTTDTTTGPQVDALGNPIEPNPGVTGGGGVP